MRVELINKIQTFNDQLIVLMIPQFKCIPFQFQLVYSMLLIIGSRTKCCQANTSSNWRVKMIHYKMRNFKENKSWKECLSSKEKCFSKNIFSSTKNLLILLIHWLVQCLNVKCIRKKLPRINVMIIDDYLLYRWKVISKMNVSHWVKMNI